MDDPEAKMGAVIRREKNPDSTFSYNNDPGKEARPVVWTNWFTAARFANWVHDGTPSGTGTETGAYTLDGASTGIFQRNHDARFWIPSEDESYKAAYYDPQNSEAGSSGHWKYAIQSNTLPDNICGGLTVDNAAN